ncbi:HlyD family secretion protein [Pseudoalteromonas sp. N1230-9]|uniref:HlyD family secretion protein n=1 Tax=Pseudoalteromonas sp. N1230-9 TaxID=2907156 RepID=UPI002B2C0192|nr:HlyD family secretion protein [Pseudoalteromonas sp. N1230-9]
MSNKFIFSSLRILLTISALVLAGITIWNLYIYYHFSPQTRDGKIRADIVQLAPDVSGRVEKVYVHDNQSVVKGTLLFSLDKARLSNEVDKAKATVMLSKATLLSAQRELERYNRLSTAVSVQLRDDKRDAVALASANMERSLAELALSELNLNRADVYSPVDGVVTNFSLRPGSFAKAGSPIMALIDQKSFYVSGYFEETKLSRISNGAKATIFVMGEKEPIYGHVEGLSAGISDSELSNTSDNMLANVNPTFSWIRLAQRIPVRIKIDRIPPEFNLIAGRTVSVSLDETN